MSPGGEDIDLASVFSEFCNSVEDKTCGFSKCAET